MAVFDAVRHAVIHAKVAAAAAVLEGGTESERCDHAKRSSEG